MSQDLKQQAIDLFRKSFSSEPKVLGIAPGRVELLGNHTDYNGGFVLSTALDRCTYVAAAPADVEGVEVTSSLYPNVERVGRWQKNEKAPWTNYVVGVLKELDEAGVKLGGMRMAVVSSVPGGSGLSSSAALEVATAKAALALFPTREFTKMELAQLCQRAENRFVGMNCGLLDQFSSTHGAEDSALFLDCMTLETRTFPFPHEKIAIILANSMTKHALVDGEYNKLREACMGAARALGKAVGRDVKLLREISVEEFEQHKDALTEDQRKRAKHVLYENQRVLDGVSALEAHDLETFGSQLYGSHHSSRDDFGNSAKNLDVLVELAKTGPGIIGARLSGGGFGGCTVNLVDPQQADAFMAHLSEGFEKATGLKTQIHRCGIGDGARSMMLD